MTRGVNDTDPRAQRVQDELLRAASPGRRLALALSLSQMTSDLARAALRRRYPEEPEEEIRLRYLEHCHGRELAERVRRYLKDRW